MRSSGASGHAACASTTAPADRGDIIAAYLRAGRRRGGAKAGDQQARYYLRLGPDPPRDDIDAIAGFYPVFRITYET